MKGSTLLCLSASLLGFAPVGRVDGEFFGGVNRADKGNSPSAVGGQFAISNKRDAGTYCASGTFAGEK